MALVTDDDVKALIDTNRDTSPFIDNAHIIVSEELSDKGLSDDRLKLIELYLAAHFVALTEERGALTRDKLGDSDQSYQLKVGTGYSLTRFGQQAMDLDSSMTLKNSTSSSIKAQFRVV